MAELLFILVTVYVAYVIFVVVECEKRKKEEARQAARASMQKAPEVRTQAPARPAVTPKPASTPKPAAPAPKPAAAAPAKANTLKNPETGEVVRVPNNYRFAKRWIKEALVSEGLVDKIYKNNELDEAASAKIQAALEKLKAMPKYQ